MLPLFIAGCATGPEKGTSDYATLPPPPSEEIRAQLGPISVTCRALANTGFAQPMGKGSAAGKSAAAGIVAAPVAGGAIGGGYGAAAGVFLSPVAGLAGAIYGAAAGMTREEYREVCVTLQNVVVERRMATRLEVATIEAIRRLAPQTTLASTNPPVVAAQCTLELTPVALNLAGERTVNPPMPLTCEVQVRLVRIADGAELFSGTFTYIASARSLREWADDGGLEFREVLATACNELADQIAERVFLFRPMPQGPAQTRILPWTSGKQD